MEPLTEAIRRADLALARGASYHEVLALLDAAERIPGANAWAPGLAQRRLVVAMYFNRPVEDVERALQARLDLEPDQLARMVSAGAAYATHPELRSYFDREIALFEDIPNCAIRAHVREHAAKVRSTVRRKFGSDV